MLADTHRLEEVLHAKSIPAWVDYWGTDVDHDWPWWHKQLGYFMGRWLDDDAKDPARLSCAGPLFVQLRIVRIGKQPPFALATLAVDQFTRDCAGMIRSCTRRAADFQDQLAPDGGGEFGRVA